MHVCYFSTWEAEAGDFVSSRMALSHKLKKEKKK